MEPTDNNNAYASSGQGTAALTLGIIGTGLYLLQNGGLGNVLGGNREALVTQRELDFRIAAERLNTEKDAIIGQLKAEKYADSATLAAERRLADKIEAIEKAMAATTLAQQHLNDVTAGFIAGVQEKTNMLMGMTGLVIKAPALLASEAAASAFTKNGATPAAANANGGSNG